MIDKRDKEEKTQESVTNPANESLHLNVERFFRDIHKDILGKTSISRQKLLFLYNFREPNITGQVIKSVGRMTWHQEPTKDVTSCDKLGLGANIH